MTLASAMNTVFKSTRERGFLKSTLAVSAVLILAFWVFVAIFAPLIAPYSERTFFHDNSFLPPGVGGVLGSDYLGRDILSRLMYGASRTLGLAFIATLIGVVGGCAAAVFRGKVDMLLSRFVDLAISFPSTMLALVIITGAGSSVPVLLLTVGFIEGVRIFRTVRAVATDLSVMDYMDIARLRGESFGWMIFREILPNASGPLLVEVGIRFTYTILFLSALSFLGLGLQPPMADWGGMVRENMQAMLLGSPAALIPAAAIASVTISVNMLVDLYSKDSRPNTGQTVLKEETTSPLKAQR